MVINGDGGQTRDFVHVEDVARANLLALERDEVTGPVNIGTGVETSVTAIATALGAAAGSAAMPVHAPARPGEQRRSCLDPARAARVLDWRPRLTLEAGLAATYEFFRQEVVR